MARLEDNAEVGKLSLLVSELAASLRPTGSARRILVRILEEALEACTLNDPGDRGAELTRIAEWVASETMEAAMKMLIRPTAIGIARSPGELGAMYLARSEPELQYSELTTAITLLAVEKSQEAAVVQDSDPPSRAREHRLIEETNFFLNMLDQVRSLRHKYIQYL